MVRGSRLLVLLLIMMLSSAIAHAETEVFSQTIPEPFTTSDTNLFKQIDFSGGGNKLIIETKVTIGPWRDTGNDNRAYGLVNAFSNLWSRPAEAWATGFTAWERNHREEKLIHDARNFFGSGTPEAFQEYKLNFDWVEGETHDFKLVADESTGTQTIFVDGVELQSVPVPFPQGTFSAGRVEFGRKGPDGEEGRHVGTRGWTFSDMKVTVLLAEGTGATGGGGTTGGSAGAGQSSEFLVPAGEYEPNTEGDGMLSELVREDGQFFEEPFGVDCPTPDSSCPAIHIVDIPTGGEPYELLKIGFDFTTHDLLNGAGKDGFYQHLVQLQNPCSDQRYYRFLVKQKVSGNSLAVLDTRGHPGWLNGPVTLSEHTQYHADIVYDLLHEEAYVTILDAAGTVLGTTGAPLNSDPSNIATVDATQDGFELVFGLSRNYNQRIYGQPHLWKFSDLVVEGVPFGGGEGGTVGGNASGADLSSDEGKLAFLAATMIGAAGGEYTLDCGPASEVLATPSGDGQEYCVLREGEDIAFGTFAASPASILDAYKDPAYAFHVEEGDISSTACDGIDTTTLAFQECPGAIGNLHTYALTDVGSGTTFVVVSERAIGNWESGILSSIIDFFKRIFGLDDDEGASAMGSLPLKRFHHGFFLKEGDRDVAATWLENRATINYRGFVTDFDAARPSSAEFLLGPGSQMLRLALDAADADDVHLWRSTTAGLRIGDVPGTPISGGYCGDGVVGYGEECEPSTFAAMCEDITEGGHSGPPSNAPPPSHPSLGPPQTYTMDGNFVPSPGDAVRRFTFDAPQGTYGKIDVDLDVTMTDWAAGHEGDRHAVLWMGNPGNRNLAGYVFVNGPGKNSVTMRQGYEILADEKSKHTQSVQFSPGTYHFAYSWDALSQQTTLTITQGSTVVKEFSGPTVDGKSSIPVSTDTEFNIDLGFPDDITMCGNQLCCQEPCNPAEPPSYGWTYANVAAKLYPIESDGLTGAVVLGTSRLTGMVVGEPQTLLERPGPFTATPSQGQSFTFDGGAGSYEIEFDVKHNGWRENDPAITGSPGNFRDIVFFNVWKNQASDSDNYLAGLGSRLQASGNEIFVHWGKNEPSTVDRPSFDWEEGQTYHVRMTFDTLANMQRTEITGPASVTSMIAPEYPLAAEMGGPLLVTFGGGDSNGLPHLSPDGWVYSNLVVRSIAGNGDTGGDDDGAPNAPRPAVCFPVGHEQECHVDIRSCLGSMNGDCYDDWTEPVSPNPCALSHRDPACPSGSGGGGGGGGGGSHDACAGVVCGEGETCHEGTCVPGACTPSEGGVTTSVMIDVGTSDVCTGGSSIGDIGNVQMCKRVRDVSSAAGSGSVQVVTDALAIRDTTDTKVCPAGYRHSGWDNPNDVKLCVKLATFSFTPGSTTIEIVEDFLMSWPGACPAGYEQLVQMGNSQTRYCAKMASISYEEGTGGETCDDDGGNGTGTSECSGPGGCCMIGEACGDDTDCCGDGVVTVCSLSANICRVSFGGGGRGFPEIPDV